MIRKHARGFTLIELMITVVIVAILAAIAYPSYQAQVRKTRRAEGQAALMQAAQTLERCFTLYNTYEDDADDAACNEGAAFTSENGYYAISFNGDPTATTFALQAVPQDAQADDAECGTLTLDQAGTKGSAAVDPLDCW